MQPRRDAGEDSETCFDGLDDRVEVRELAGLPLGVKFVSIDADFEDAAACGNELQRSNALFEFQELDRQTDGLRLIVSSGAIFDRKFRFHLRAHRAASQAAGQVAAPRSRLGNDR